MRNRSGKRKRIVVWALLLCILIPFLICSSTLGVVGIAERSLWLGDGTNYMVIMASDDITSPHDPSTILIGVSPPMTATITCVGIVHIPPRGQGGIDLLKCKR